MSCMRIAALIAVASWLASPRTSAQAEEGNMKVDYMPEIHGTIRAKYEYEPPIGKGRFEVRNARVSVDGKIVPAVRYKAEIDLSDEGSIKMLDAYVRILPVDLVGITVGQMRVPFTIDAHRSPHQQYFANRSFIAKQVGNVRDVGATVSWNCGDKIPVTLECGVFNGSGLTGQKNFWTGAYNFSFKARTVIKESFNIILSCQRANAGKTNVMMYDAGAYWGNSRWHIEAEYLRKYYAHGTFRPVNAADAFLAYRLPLKKGLSSISFLARYDYMSDHNDGGFDDNGNLTVDDPERHRLTGGITLGLRRNSLQADLRLNYEQYFYSSGTTPAISEQNKIVAEVVVRF